MTFSTTRLTAIAAAAMLTLSLAVPPAFAQATIAPPGGTPSTTAPSNQEGTPTGGTGDIGTTRVGPSGTTAPMATTRYHHRRHYRRHYRHHTATPRTTATPAPSN